MKFTRLLLLSALCLLSIGCARKQPSLSAPTPMKTYYNTPLQIGQTRLMVEVATTTVQMAKGLSDRETLKENEGMLFDYRGKKVRPAFWMPDMNFNIDIIWISEGKVVGAEKNVPALKVPKDQLPIYRSPVPVDMVLETVSGFTDKHGVKSGDEVKVAN